MKIRNGFVSNSSSSSFICNVCGEAESGYDESMQDLGIQMCEHEHYYHTGHISDDFMEAGKDVWYNYIKKHLTKSYEKQIETVNKYKQKLAGILELTEWEQSAVERNENFLQQQVNNATSSLLYREEELNKLENDYIELDEDDFFDKYADTLYDLISEFGVPEEYCPVCKKIKEYSQDPDWNKYLELKEKFNDIHI